MSEFRRISASGTLSTGELKRLTSLTRDSTIGPTALYYSGVTAPVITAGMALMSESAFSLAGFTPYWRVMVSAIVAAMAGIVWYLIFTRWAYRHRHGRAGETGIKTHIELLPDSLSVRRGDVETRIGYSAIRAVEHRSRAVLIRAEGADTLLVPDNWFASKEDRDMFRAQLLTRGA